MNETTSAIIAIASLVLVLLSRPLEKAWDMIFKTKRETLKNITFKILITCLVFFTLTILVYGVLDVIKHPETFRTLDTAFLCVIFLIMVIMRIDDKKSERRIDDLEKDVESLRNRIEQVIRSQN